MVSLPLLAPSLPGGVVDEVLCSQPDEMKNKELHAVPYQLFHSCMTTSYNYLFANLHHLEAERSLRGHAHLTPGMHSPLGGSEDHGGGGGGGGRLPECEPKQRPRPVNLRYAIVTLVITGVLCGIEIGRAHV